MKISPSVLSLQSGEAMVNMNIILTRTGGLITPANTKITIRN